MPRVRATAITLGAQRGTITKAPHMKKKLKIIVSFLPIRSYMKPINNDDTAWAIN